MSTKQKWAVPPSPPKRDKAPALNYFAAWSEVTTFHGIRDFYTAKRCVTKLVWFLVVTGGCVCAINQSVTLLLDFAWQDQWLSSVRTQAPDGLSMKWPNVTICNPNLLDKEMLAEVGLGDPRFVSVLVGGQAELSFYDKMQAETQLYKDDLEVVNATMQILQMLNLPGNPVKKVSAMLTQRCLTTVVRCGGINDLLVAPRENIHSYNCCSPFSASAPYDSHCFRLNPTNTFGELGPLSDAGYTHRIFYLLNPGVTTYYDNLLLSKLPTAGFEVRLYFNEDDSDGFASPDFISPGTHSVIAMTAEKRRTTGRSRSLAFYSTKLPCTSEASYKWFKVDSPSRQVCALDCAASFYMELCNCTNEVASKVPHLVWKQGAKKCSNSELQTCRKIVASINLSELDNFEFNGFNITKCLFDCQDPCDFDMVDTKVSSNQFPAPNTLQAFTTYLNRASADHNFSADIVSQMIFLEMYYERKEYRVVEKMPRVSLDELIGSIGGTLGVWIGVSFISVFQALVYLITGLVAALESVCCRFSKRNVGTA